MKVKINPRFFARIRRAYYAFMGYSVMIGMKIDAKEGITPLKKKFWIDGCIITNFTESFAITVKAGKTK